MPTVLTSNTGSFPKFKNIGDSVTGRLQSFQRDVPGTFGPEDTAKLIGDDGETLIVRCQTDLANIIEANFDTLKEVRARYAFVKTAPSKKGNPIKKFEVTILDGDDATAFPPAANEPMAEVAAAAKEEAELEARLAAARARRAA